MFLWLVSQSLGRGPSRPLTLVQEDQLLVTKVLDDIKRDIESHQLSSSRNQFMG
jgi:hypothetical protein